MNKIKDKQQCPLCEKNVRFAEIRTRTEVDTTKGIKWVQVIVSRCPECKRVVGSGMPINSQDEEI
ncbi:MAG: hypothetical protein K8R16_12645 [Anaerolineales bacterium]|nr:hypothetical protein [Anaerolineales bacterium]